VKSHEVGSGEAWFQRVVMKMSQLQHYKETCKEKKFAPRCQVSQPFWAGKSSIKVPLTCLNRADGESLRNFLAALGSPFDTHDQKWDPHMTLAYRYRPVEPADAEGLKADVQAAWAVLQRVLQPQGGEIRYEATQLTFFEDMTAFTPL